MSLGGGLSSATGNKPCTVCFLLFSFLLFCLHSMRSAPAKLHGRPRFSLVLNRRAATPHTRNLIGCFFRSVSAPLHPRCLLAPYWPACLSPAPSPSCCDWRRWMLLRAPPPPPLNVCWGFLLLFLFVFLFSGSNPGAHGSRAAKGREGSLEAVTMAM